MLDAYHLNAPSIVHHQREPGISARNSHNCDLEWLNAELHQLFDCHLIAFFQQVGCNSQFFVKELSAHVNRYVNSDGALFDSRNDLDGSRGQRSLGWRPGSHTPEAAVPGSARFSDGLEGRQCTLKVGNLKRQTRRLSSTGWFLLRRRELADQEEGNDNR